MVDDEVTDKLFLHFFCGYLCSRRGSNELFGETITDLIGTFFCSPPCLYHPPFETTLEEKM